MPRLCARNTIHGTLSAIEVPMSILIQLVTCPDARRLIYDATAKSARRRTTVSPQNSNLAAFSPEEAHCTIRHANRKTLARRRPRKRGHEVRISRHHTNARGDPLVIQIPSDEKRPVQSQTIDISFPMKDTNPSCPQLFQSASSLDIDSSSTSSITEDWTSGTGALEFSDATANHCPEAKVTPLVHF